MAAPPELTRCQAEELGVDLYLSHSNGFPHACGGRYTWFALCVSVSLLLRYHSSVSGKDLQAC